MKKFLIVLLSLAINSLAFSSEDITLPDGREGIFFESESAKKLLADIEEFNSLKKRYELLEKENTVLENIIKFQEKKDGINEDISDSWKDNYNKALEELKDKQKELDFKTDIRVYTNIGVFFLGTMIGGGIMYGSSLLIANTVK